MVKSGDGITWPVHDALMAAAPGPAAGTTLETGVTADLSAASLRAARALLDEVFFPEMTDDDWDHALGGQHVLLWERGHLVAHAALVERRLTAGATQLRTGYVEAVAVRADRQRRGYGAAVMAPLESEIARSYDVGALGSSELGAAFYRTRGWQVWRGPTWARTPNGLMRTPDEDGWIYVLDAGGALDLTEPLICDWRCGDVW
jgi:aminoglycoside 2'-N-acetyltransferase I